jgi:hypothetical protein
MTKRLRMIWPKITIAPKTGHREVRRDFRMPFAELVNDPVSGRIKNVLPRPHHYVEVVQEQSGY